MDVGLQQLLELAQPVRDPRHQVVHPAQIWTQQQNPSEPGCRPASLSRTRVTFVLVGVQQVLELGVEDLQVLLDQNLLTLAGQFVLRGLVQVDLDTALLLQQPGLGLRVRTGQNRDGGAGRGPRRPLTFFMYSVTGFCCRNSVLSRV